MASKDERDEITWRIHEARQMLNALPPGERVRLQLLALARHGLKFFKAVWLICAEGYNVSQAGRIMRCARKTARTWCDSGLDYVATLERPASA